VFYRQIVSYVFIIIYLFNHQLPFSCDSFHVSQSSSLPTTFTAQFADLNTIPLSFYLTPSRSCFSSIQCLFLSILIALSGDAELNPGPIFSKLNGCTLNIRSLTKPFHYNALAGLAGPITLISSLSLKLGSLLISHKTTSAELLDAAPGFTLISNPRPVSTSNISSVTGGGTACLIRQSCRYHTVAAPGVTAPGMTAPA
jgi:hypothetical protein